MQLDLSKKRAKMINMPTNAFGRTSIFEDGMFQGSLTRNPFGNLVATDSTGNILGHTQTDGLGNQQLFDEDFNHIGFSRPNVNGGFDTYSDDGGGIGHTFVTATGAGEIDSDGEMSMFIGDSVAGDDVFNAFNELF